MPPSECVESVRRTLFQPWTRMSGWWFGASADLRDALDEGDRRGEVGERQSRTIASPSRRHSPPSRPLVDLRVAQQWHIVPPSSAACVVSLVPSATEMLFALGLGDEVVAVTHECDYPAGGARAADGHARRAAGDLTAGQIDAAVRAAPTRARRSTSSTREALHELRARPDRHAGAVRGLRGLLRRRAGDRRADRAAARR